MWEMIRHAWEGWNAMHLSGKYIALVFLLLVYLWICKVGYTMKEEQKHILWYTTVLAPLCVCPLTAALLMSYQTRFYDYPWVWSLVPVTTFIAMGATILLVRMQEGPRLPERWQQAIFAVALVVLLWVSGGLGSQERTLAQDRADYETAELLVEALKTSEEGEIGIWGPTMVQEYVRMIDPKIQVPYGRNMWDASLNAYFYDAYDADSVLLYKTMCYAQEKSRFTDYEVLSVAATKGVTHLILPGYVLYSDVEAVAECLGSEIRQLQGYFVIPVQ